VAPDGEGELLKRAGLVSVSVSLDHGTAEAHDAVRGYPGAFQAALRAIGLFREAGLHTGVSAVLSAGMIRRGEVVPFLEFLESLGLDEAWLSETKPSLPAPETAEEAPTPDELRGLHEAQDRWNRDRSRTMTVNILSHFESGAHFGCNAGTKMVYVDAYGEVSPCVFVPMSFGNIRQRPLAEIWADVRGGFRPGSECFIRSQQRPLRSLAAGGLPIPPPASRDFLKSVDFGAPARFVTLLRGEGGRAR
jgi:MoaA/NifB/PqqE/SkfB family radical SAM enzyme